MLLHMNLNWADGAEAKVHALCFWLSYGDELHTDSSVSAAGALSVEVLTFPEITGIVGVTGVAVT